MKKKEKTNRNKRVTLRFMQEEYEQIDAKFKKTTCRKLSKYMRDILLDKKITAYTRNQSLDEFMAEMVQLRRELNAIGNNFNQVVKRLHTLNTLHELKSWMIMNEASNKFLTGKMEEIKIKINQFSDKWLQE